MGVVFVHQRQVVIDVLLLGIHAAHSVLDDDRYLVAESRIVGNAVRYRRCVQMGMPVLVLETFAIEGRSSGSAAEQEAARTHVAGGPCQIADPLEAEHRVENVEGDHRHAVRRIARRRRYPVAHRARLVDPFLQDLAVLALLVEH